MKLKPDGKKIRSPGTGYYSRSFAIAPVPAHYRRATTNFAGVFSVDQHWQRDNQIVAIPPRTIFVVVDVGARRRAFASAKQREKAPARIDLCPSMQSVTIFPPKYL